MSVHRLTCDGCSRCACGCLEPARQGFDRIDDGAFKGRGAGYSLIRRRRGWQVLDPEGKTVSFSEHQASLDIANQVATGHARGTGHGHP